jgi:hypothetical protein
MATGAGGHHGQRAVHHVDLGRDSGHEDVKILLQVMAGKFVLALRHRAKTVFIRNAV